MLFVGEENLVDEVREPLAMEIAVPDVIWSTKLRSALGLSIKATGRLTDAKKNHEQALVRLP